MSNTRKNVHGGVARPKRFLRRHHSSRRPSGLQGIATDRKSRFLSRKMSMHPHHSVSHHNQSRPNVSMKQARKPRGSKKSNNQKIKYAKAYNHELHFNNAIKQSRVGEQASARASRAMRGRNGHMRNNNGAASASASSAKGRRSSWFPKRGDFHRELSAAASSSHNGHAAAASSGPRDPRDLLDSQGSQ